MEINALSVEDFFDKHQHYIHFPRGQVEDWMRAALAEGGDFKLNTQHETLLVPNANLVSYFKDKEPEVKETSPPVIQPLDEAPPKPGVVKREVIIAKASAPVADNYKPLPTKARKRAAKK